MAILLLIGSDIVNEPYQYLNDVVTVFEDSHVFSDTELEQFNFLHVNGSMMAVNNVLTQIKPRIAKAFYYNQTWSFLLPDIPLPFESADVWFDSPNKWMKLVNPFKFPINVNNLTPEEKQLLETYDITHPSIGAFINKIVKDITNDPANMEEIRDLRGLEP